MPPGLPGRYAQSVMPEPTTPTTDVQTSPQAATTPAVDDDRAAMIASGVEALLFSASKPLPAALVAETIASAEAASSPETANATGRSMIDAGHVDAAVDALNARYDAGGHAFSIERVAGGFRVMTRPEHAGLLARFHQSRASTKLSRAAIETAAIVAYQQPITRARLESIRGVACGEVLRSLLEKRLIAIVGRAEELGRPMLYGTTKRFLDVFGLASIKDLPDAGPDLPTLPKREAEPARDEAPAKPDAEASRTDPV